MSSTPAPSSIVSRMPRRSAAWRSVPRRTPWHTSRRSSPSSKLLLSSSASTRPRARHAPLATHARWTRSRPTLVERVTGQTSAAAVPIEVGVIMSDRSLFGVDQAAAMVEAYGPVPSSSIRQLLARPVASPAQTSAGPPTSMRPDPDPRVWLRRFYADPISGVITSSERTRRLFDAHVRRLVMARDQWCRTPFCGAPIRHVDHALGFARGGATSVDNAQGLCERCNHAKEAPGWATTSDLDPTGRALVTTTTAAGLHYTTSPPPWRPGWSAPRDRATSLSAVDNAAEASHSRADMSTEAPPLSASA